MTIRISIKGKILSLLFVLILITSGVIRLLQSTNFDFPFTYDQAATMLDVRVMGHFYDFKISGPTTSIPGLNVGPFYDLFLLPAYWLGGGSPQALVTWNIIWFLLSAVAIYIFFYKRNRLLGFFISTIYLMSPQLFPITRYFWNANSATYFTVFYFLAFWNFIEKGTKKEALIWGITAGLIIQFEAAFGSLCVAFSFLAVLISRKRANIGYYLMGLIPWFIPQIVYEVTHKFQMTKILLGAFSSTTSILGVSAPLMQTVGMHWKSITSVFEGQFTSIPYGMGFALLILGIIASLATQKYRKNTLYYVSFIAFVFVYFVLVYRHELKPWYLDGVRVWYCFVIGMALISLIQYKNRLILLLITLFLARSFYLTVIDQYSYIKDNGKSNDPKNAANIIKSISWAYGKADGEGFDAYNYVPEVYDYSAQYLYWWYGGKTFGFTPQHVSYSLSPVPQYVRDAEKFQQKAKPSTSDKIALMYETIGDYQGWLVQFKNYCVLDKQTFGWNVTVEWRESCKSTKQLK